MTATDYLGNEISTTEAATLAAINDFVGGLLGYELRVLNIWQAAAADPESCLASTYAAALSLLGETMDAPLEAAPHLARAAASSAHANDRERRLLRFVQLWADDAIPAARELGEATLSLYPRDLALLKLLQYLAFIGGDLPGMLRVARVAAPAAQDVTHFHGMHAFALEECQAIDAAKRAGETALKLAEREPWAQHALAHIALAEGRIDEGSRFLEAAEPGWTGLTSFMSTHLWWHRCLFYLSQGRFERLLGIYDAKCWGIVKSFSQDQIGAVSLLARFELAGVDVGERWRDLGNHLAARADDTAQPFLTMQYLYGLARAARPEADLLMQRIEERATTAPGYAQRAWRLVALPACTGMLAHARGDYRQAADRMADAVPLLPAIGGSHAQRDLFEQIYLDALVRTENWTTAKAVLEGRRRFDPEGVPLNRALAEVNARLGLSFQ